MQAVRKGKEREVQYPGREMERRRETGEPERAPCSPVRIDEEDARLRREGPPRADRLEIRERPAVRADEHMLAVVDNVAGGVVPEGVAAPAEPGRLLQESDARPSFGEADRRGQAAHPAADDDDVARHAPRSRRWK